MSLTIAYVTARRDPKIEWFFDSLRNQIVDDSISIIVVDHNAPDVRVAEGWNQLWDHGSFPRFTHVAPKPNVWNGPYRLTKENWFACANARNTAICLCETSHIAFIDDLSVLQTGWLNAVNEAVAGNYIGCGAYQKCRKLVVENGRVVNFDSPVGETGIDQRLSRVSQDVSTCLGQWLYGCSFVAPLEDLLDVGGFPEFTDGLGGEDYCLGIALQNAGKQLKFDRRMMTFESEELHHVEVPMKRTDKGVSPNDKSHAALAIARGSNFFSNYYEGGMRALRDHVLAGNPFPIVKIPDTCWFDGQPLKEM